MAKKAQSKDPSKPPKFCPRSGNRECCRWPLGFIVCTEEACYILQRDYEAQKNLKSKS